MSNQAAVSDNVTRELLELSGQEKDYATAAAILISTPDNSNLINELYIKGFQEHLREIAMQADQAEKLLDMMWNSAREALKDLPKEAQAVMQIYAELIATETRWGTSCMNDPIDLLTESEMQEVLSTSKNPAMSFFREVRDLIALCHRN